MELCITTGKLEDQSLGPFCENRGRYSTYLDSYECIPATFLGLLRFSSLIFEQSAVFSNHKKI